MADGLPLLTHELLVTLIDGIIPLKKRTTHVIRFPGCINKYQIDFGKVYFRPLFCSFR